MDIIYEISIRNQIYILDSTTWIPHKKHFHLTVPWRKSKNNFIFLNITTGIHDHTSTQITPKTYHFNLRHPSGESVFIYEQGLSAVSTSAPQTPSHHKLWENTEGARERHRQRERVSPVWDRIKIPLVRLPGSNNAPFCWRGSFSADRVMVTGMLQAFRVDSVFKDFYAEDLRTSTGDPFLRRQRGGVLRDLKCWLGIVVCWAVTNALFPYDFWYV